MINTIIGRVCIRKSDSKLIEFQSGRDKHSRKVLEENALAAGYSENEIQEREVTTEEYVEIMTLQPVLEKPKRFMKLKHPDTGTIAEWEVVE